MKRIIMTLTACLVGAIVATSCGKSEGSANGRNSKSELDTLSYIVGMDVANGIENNMVKQFDVDYKTLKKTIEKALNGKTIKIEDVTISKENINEIGPKYMNNEFGARVMAAQSDTTGNTKIYTDEKERQIISALLGADIAFSTERLQFEVNKESFLAGIDDTHENKAFMTQEEAMEYVQNYFTVTLPANNKRDSEAWLQEVANEKGVQKTESGIVYKIENEGDSQVKATKDEDVVKVLYTGRTRTGKVFDSNRWNDMPAERQSMMEAYQPDQAGKDNPIEFALNQVIKGWTEGMKLIGKGGKITLWIPSELAYGERGTGRDIGPNEALRFDVELLDVTVK